MTSKENMSEFLLRLQQWQRMSLGFLSFAITTLVKKDGCVFFLIEYDSIPMSISEGFSEKENKDRMRTISDYLHKKKVI